MTISPVELPSPSPFLLKKKSIANRQLDALNIIHVTPKSPEPIQKDRVTQVARLEPLAEDLVAAEEELRQMNLVPANKYVDPDDEVDRSKVMPHLPRYSSSSSHESDRLLKVERGGSSAKKDKNCATSRLVQFTAFACFCIGTILVFGGVALSFRTHG